MMEIVKRLNEEGINTNYTMVTNILESYDIDTSLVTSEEKESFEALVSIVRNELK